LSRTAQAVELDLSVLTGRIPIDALGGSTFPPVGQLPYLLTLPPYAFYWFILTTEAELPHWHKPAPEPLPELATLVLRSGLANVLAEPARHAIEVEALPAYLARRRWFASKDKRIEATRLALAEELPVEGTMEVLLTEVGVKVGGREEHYLLPLGIAWEDAQPSAMAQQLALARVRRGRRVGLLTDAFALDALPHAVINGMRRRAVVKMQQGELRALPTSHLDTTEFPAEPDIRRLSAEQSNSSLIFGDTAVIKLVRRVTAGIHPETEMGRFLTEHGYANTPPLLGEIVHVGADGVPHTLVVAQGFVRNQGDGWQWTTDYLGREVAPLALTDSSAEQQTDIFSGYTVFAVAVGRRLGELHALLSLETDDPAFQPETVEKADTQHWTREARAQLQAAYEALDNMKELPESAAGLARRLREQREDLMAAIPALAGAGVGTLKTRVHGDFHLGQVLVAQGDAFLIDFEGEPAKPLEARRAKACPLRDVAGMLRSFDYAAASVAPGRSNVPAANAERQERILRRFRDDVSDAFLTAYRAAHDAAERRWAPPEAEAKLTDLYLLEKAAYEICYEAANRPSWLAIPLRGLAELADRLLAAPAKPVPSKTETADA
jgi:maltose alpha-D-glucosyltransferase/alpha-amylase